MSMNGQFVQITSDQLAALIHDPSRVEELFGPGSPGSGVSAASMQKFVGLLEAKRKELVERGPQMIEAVLARMDPKAREATSARLVELGINADSLKSGAAGEAMIKLLMARAGLAAGGGGSGGNGQGGASQSPNAPAVSLSIDKTWHGIHYLLSGGAVPTTAPISKVIMGGTEVGDDFSGYGEARYFDAKETAAIAAELNRGTLEAEMTARYDPAQMEKLGIYPGVWTGPDAQWLMREFRNLRAFFAAAAKGFAVLTCLV